MIRTDAPDGAQDRGFTLVELLVSFALLAVLSSLIVGVIQLATKALKGAERRSETASVEAVQSLLTALIEQAQPRAAPPTEADPRASLNGSASGLRFVTSYSPPGQYDGLYEVELSAPPSDGGNVSLVDVVLTQTLYRPPRSRDRDGMRPSTTTHLLLSVRALSVSYFGAYDLRDEPRWRSTWEHPTRLPHLVRIEVVFDAGDPRTWPPLVAPLILSD